MRIVLDLQGCQSVSRFRGIGRYSLALANAIVRNANGHEVWIVLNDLFPDTVDGIRQSFAHVLPPERIVIFSLPLITRFQNARDWRNRAAALIREHAIAELRPDIVHISSLFEGYTDFSVSSVNLLERDVLTAVTLYDLIPFLDPKRYLADPGFAEHYYAKIEALKRADVLLAISSFCGEEAIRELGISRDVIANVSSAVSDAFVPPCLSAVELNDVHRRYGLSRPFVMTTGIVEPRKNLDGLIAAYARLPALLRKRFQLFIICQANEESAAKLFGNAKSHGLAADELVLSGYVPDADLTALYGSCDLFVFPSLHEGFGLPALEAMACGAPVIGSAATSIPEVIGRDDALFNPLDHNQMASMIERGLTDEEYRQTLKENAAVQVPKFSWNETGRRVIRAFESAYAKYGSHRSGEHSSKVSETAYRSLINALAALEGPVSESDLVAAADAVAANQHVDRLPRLLVDVSVLSEHDARSGIQRVTRAIVRHLLMSPPRGWEVRPVRLDRSVMIYRYANQFVELLETGATWGERHDEWVDTQQGDVFLGLDLVADCVPDVTDWFAAQRRRGVKIYFVVYDLLPIHRPDWFPKAIATAFPSWLATISSISDGLVAISRAVADDLCEMLASPATTDGRMLDIGFFHLGADVESVQPSAGLPEDAALVLSKLRAHQTFLMVGTVEPRKGHKQALTALEELWSAGEELNLVIVGRAGWGVDEIASSLKAHRQYGVHLFWFDDASDEFLDLIYDASSALLVPSLGEGFGLPLIEAAKKNLPIIARDLPVFREVAGDRAFYFDGHAAEDLARAIKSWLRLSLDGHAPESAGIGWLTWQQSADQLTKVVLDGEWCATVAACMPDGR
jgi:glycosyltransferase involved in cell wall biosynthesis